MKQVSVLALSVLTTIGVMPCVAHAAHLSPLHANGITVSNIAVMQHGIFANAFNNFDASPAVAFENYAEPLPKKPQPNHTTDRYGKMLTYGEYGDDGTVFLSRGRNGGDAAVPTSNWVDWQHARDTVKFDGFNKVNSRYDIVSLGFSDTPEQISGGFSEFGGFGGIITAKENNSATRISENGGFFGLYRGYHLHGLNIQTAANIGIMFDDAESAFGDYDYTNTWAGAAVSATYNIVLDNMSMIQPGLYAGYTWIYTDGYESESGHGIKVDDFNMLELSPSVRAITHVADGWYGIMSVRYAFNFTDGGNARVSGIDLDDLDLGDYCEFGVSVEKSIERFNFALSINRRDGGRTGWNGDVRIRYMF